jgi:hypothetical protein
MLATSSTTLSFIDERLFLTMTWLVLPLDESTAEPLQAAAKSVANPAIAKAVVDPATELLHSIANPTAAWCYSE